MGNAYTFRMATEPGDYDRLVRSLRETTRCIEEGTFATPGDLDWWLGIEDDVEAKLHSIPLWLDGDRVIGWGYTYKGQIDLFVSPDRHDLLPLMVEWAEGSAREAGADVFEVFANDDHLVRQHVFRDAGLAVAEDHYTFRRHSLTGELPAPHLPDGYRFRDMTVLDGDTLERRVDLHRVVWAPSRWTPAKHARLMQTRHYRPDLDLIAVAPNGDFAAYTIVWFDPVQKIGAFEPVGCHPDYRRLGLTSAIMFEGLRRLNELGAETAFVNSWFSSLPANRLYESCGFTEVGKLHKWSKALT